MIVISSPTQALLALSALKGIGPAALKKVAALTTFWELSLEDWCRAVPQVAKSADGQPSGLAWQEAKDWANEQVAAAEKHSARIISPIDDEYPRLLAATKDDPFLLFVKGRFAESPQQSVAIIGTREPTQHGQLIAQRITQFFAEQHWSVISGLAIGCDGIAHQTAIEARGHTIAVLAHGLQMIAPSRHKKLAQDILDAGGALISEYPFGRNVVGAQFVKRDRTQAGMSQGVVMIQSDVKGGSLHASRAALSYQRWLAVPYPTDKDLENREPKIQANLVIADGPDAQRADLLRCPTDSLGLVRVVRRREDYLRLIAPEEAKALAFLEGGRDIPPEVTSPIDDGQDHASEPHQDNITVGNTVSKEGLRTTESHPESILERKKDVEELAPVLEATQHAEEAAVPRTAIATYYLEVSLKDFKKLKKAQVLTGDESFASGDHPHNYDMNVLSALSRLDHLQTKLNELKKLLTSKRPMGVQQALRSQFQIEDVLTHMKRAMEEFVRLDHGAHGRSLNSVVVRQGVASGQPELPLLGAAVGELRDAPFNHVLDRLVDSLPSSVSVEGYEKAREPFSRELRIKIQLDDLVFSLSELVKTVLSTRDSHASTTTISS
jgi:DNA protecting protein DprA